MTAWHKTAEYKLIYEHYRGKVAERSGVPLMHHIREGIHLLRAWNRSDLEIRAFALHPLVQNGLLVIFESPCKDSYLLAEEYSIAANSYLCRPENDDMSIAKLRQRLGNLSEEAAWMLLADKVQNQTDFRIHHWFTHERRFQLDRYFEIWIDTLRSFYIGWKR